MRATAFIVHSRIVPIQGNLDIHSQNPATQRLRFNYMGLPDLVPSHGRCATTALALTPSGKKENHVEVGIQTAQLLMDARRRDELNKKMKLQFPLVPEPLIDSCIDITAQAFTQVAPEKLKVALRPGGFDQMRPEIEQVIVDYALEQPVVQNAPLLGKKDKRKLLESIVSMALEYVIKDAQEVLTAPEVRLEELEEQVKEVKAQMGPGRLFWYRIRHNPKRIVFAFALSLTAILVCQQRNVPIVARLLAATAKTSGKVSNTIGMAATSCWTATRTATGYLVTVPKKLLQR